MHNYMQNNFKHLKSRLNEFKFMYGYDNDSANKKESNLYKFELY